MRKDPVWKHMVLWTSLYVLWVFIFQSRTLAVSRTLTVQFCYLAFIASAYYFIIYFSVPRFLYKRNYAVFVLLLLGAITAAALLRVPLAMYLNKHVFMPGKPQPGFQQLFTTSLLNIFVWVVSLIAVTLIVEKVRFQKFMEVLEKEKTKNELDFLKAQFNPHFLFNSINSIYGHIEKGNMQARKMLLTFSDMLRYQLYECNVESIAIEKEIDYIKNYVALQKTRKEENLLVNVCIGSEVKGFPIAPMLFIAFIENAFKYVSNDDQKENKVEISLHVKDECLTFESINTKDVISHNAPIRHRGIGINNVKRRLELLYPEKHQLSIRDNNEIYHVSLKLQLQ